MELEGLITLLQMCESNKWFQEVHIDKGEPGLFFFKYLVVLITTLSVVVHPQTGIISKTKFMAVQILSKEQVRLSFFLLC